MKAMCDRFLPSKCSSSSSTADEKRDKSTLTGWTVIVNTASSMASGAIRGFKIVFLGPSRTGIPSTTSEIWLLGFCYRISEGESSDEADAAASVLDAFRQDFSSLILVTYHRGFEPVGDRTYTSDVGWGCMLRSGQILFAQALLFQRLGRSWRKKESEPPEEEYLEILFWLEDYQHILFLEILFWLEDYQHKIYWVFNIYMFFL